MAGRRPTPTALKVLEGNPGKRPLNQREPKPQKRAPRCPDWLEDEAKAEWARLSDAMERMGILTEMDMAAFASYCQSYARWKEAEEHLTIEGRTIDGGKDGKVVASPYVSIAQNYMKSMNRYASEFGLTPAARSRIIAGNGQQGESTGDEMDDLLSGRVG